MHLFKKSWMKPAPSVALFVMLVLFLPMITGPAQNPELVSTSIPSTTTRDYWPNDGWRNRTPEEQGMSSAILNDMMALIEEEEYPIHSVLIIKNGYAVFEQYPSPYYNNITLHSQHSVSKSVVSILLGVAFQESMLDNVSQKMLDFFPEYNYLDLDPGWANITIEHLLTMTPGYDWDEWSSPYVYPGDNPIMNMMYSHDAIEYILNRSIIYEPGEYWAYNGGASVLLGAIIQQVYDDQVYYVFREHLFNHIGVDYFSLPPLPGGWYNVMGGFSLRAVDMAKLGFLYLNNGTWNGTQLVSEEFVANSITPIPHENPLGSQFGYGWHWWLRSDLGIYFAYGRHGQKIMVSPEHDMIVVFTAGVGDDEYDPEFDLFRNYILRSILVDNGSSIPLETVAVVILASVGLIAVVIVFVKRRN